MTFKNIAIFIFTIAALIFIAHVYALIENFKQYDSNYEKSELTKSINCMHDLISLQNSFIFNKAECKIFGKNIQYEKK
tara:strand:+ start:258 stop:491 length:234 start_codon:yes stop_codon:yes gene_type:complete